MERDKEWMPGALGLWSAVLMVAVEDARGRYLAIDSLQDRLRSYSTRQWFRSSNGDPGWFTWICDILNLEPEWIRRLALGDTAPSSLATSATVAEVKSFL